MSKKTIVIAALWIVWIETILAVFYLVQKPQVLQVVSGLSVFFGTLILVGALVILSASCGGFLLMKIAPAFDPAERVLLGSGLGLGVFGLLGFGLAAAGLARPVVLGLILLMLGGIVVWRGWLFQTWRDIAFLWSELRVLPERSLRWAPWFLGAFGALAFILSFAPPADSFDALFYHLTVPLAWLKDGGIAQSRILPHYWFPELVEGIFVWGLAFGFEASAALIHLIFGGLTVLLVWWWARKLDGAALAWRAAIILISMPSLPLLAAWAYTDLALAFYSLAAVYMVSLAWRADDDHLWILAGIACGLAMGVKYTSVVLPVVVGGFLLWLRCSRPRGWWMGGAKFAGAALLTASPWYLRNWVWMGNPFYPFVFGGKGWDAFLAQQYSQAGTGIGVDVVKWLTLPLTVTLGHHDANFYDGRIGPFWLILLPAALWVLWSRRKHQSAAALWPPFVFAVASCALWVVGVVNSSALWQSRLLFPALMPLAPLFALGWGALSQWDNRLFRLSFIFNGMVVLALLASLVDFSLFTLVRNPLAAVLKINDRQSYFERFQPNYAAALSLIEQTPADARVYFLFEPRSYEMGRFVQPDAFLQNFAHSLYLYGSPEAALKSWATEGYDYVLYQRAGRLEQSQDGQALLSALELVSETGNTALYRIP